jgi:hypothetical protein
MKRIAVLSFVGTLLLGTAVAQTSAASQTNASASQSTSVSADRSGAQVDFKGSAKAAQSANVANKSTDAAAASQLESGSSIHATLERPVDARKNKPGDQVVAKTSEDVKSEGKVVIPRGSKIVGHVTEVKAREKGQAESAVGVVFDHAVLKDGSHMPLSLTVQAVSSGATTAQAQDDSLMSSGDTAAMGNVNGTGSSMTRTGGGLVGGVRSTTGGLVNTAGSVGGATVNTATGAGAGASSSLNSNSQGVIGLRGLNLASSASSSNSGTFTSQNSNVHLDSGTQMILRVQK